MKQSKFPLADVLTVLTALAFGFICFLGKNFYSLGNTTVSITWAAIITVSLAGTALIAKSLKRTGRNFKTSFILEIAVLILFTGLTVFFALSLFPHYFNVSDKKTEIQNILQTSITQAENLFPEYEAYAIRRENTFKSGLKAAETLQNPNDLRKYALMDKSQVPYNTQIEHKMSTLHTYLFPPGYSDTINKDGIKEVATTWLSKAKKIKNSWNPISIVHVVNDVERNSEKWKIQLIGFSQKVNIPGENFTPFVYQLNFTNVKTYFTATGKPTLLSIALSAGAYLLMLLSWFVTKRHSRSTGMLTSAPYEVVL